MCFAQMEAMFAEHMYNATARVYCAAVFRKGDASAKAIKDLIRKLQ
jgi:hypothetical protein